MYGVISRLLEHTVARSPCDGKLGALLSVLEEIWCSGSRGGVHKDPTATTYIGCTYGPGGEP
jgi:hypothetical protein